MELSIQSVTEIIGGRLRLAAMPPLGGVWEPIGALVTQACEVGEGDVLIASAESSDQHECAAAEAFDRGALGVIHAGWPMEPWPGRFSICVDDLSWALWQLARAARNEYDGRVIAIAGAVGKSITCAMIDAVLAQCDGPWRCGEVHGSCALPEQLLRMSDQQQYAVLELGEAASGDLDAAVHLACPDVGGVVNPLGNSSTDDPWSELLAALPDDGCAIVGPDADHALQQTSSCRVLTFGRRGECDVSASHVLCEEGRLSLAVDGQLARLPVWGRHHLASALAAWCVGRAAGIPERQIADRLANVNLPVRRCEVSRRHTSQGGEVTFIDDTACDSPPSRRAPLELLNSIKGRRRIVIYAADDHEANGHRQWGRDVVEVGGADVLMTLGPTSEELVRGAIDAGMPPAHCHRCDDSEQLEKKISTFLASGDLVLHKGVDAHARNRVLALFSNTPPGVAVRRAAA